MNRTLKIITIVKEYLREQGKHTTHDLASYLDFAIKALRYIEFDYTGTPVSKYVKVNSNDQIVIPSDCIRVVDLGIVNSSNNFISLGLGDKIANTRNTDDSGNPQKNSTKKSTSNGGYNSSLNVNRHGENLGGNFGNSGGVGFGSWDIDYERGFININGGSDSAKKYMLIYTQNISAPTGEFLVHEYMREPILAGIELFSKRRRPSTPKGEIERLEHNFTWTQYHMAERFDSLTRSQMINESRKNKGFTKG